MILFPAIDLKDNQVVRLRLGEMDQATIFNSDPVGQAQAFAAAGFEWLHLVDLNGAFAGRSMHEPLIESILSATRLPVQLGGGIRSLERIERWLEIGVNRVILGTVAVKDPALVREACKHFPGRIVVGVDARQGRVAVEGWAEVSDLGVAELARRFEDAGAAALIYTDIERDGVLTGVNVESTVELARATRLPVIASGGVASLDDLTELMAYEEEGICGVVCGRALYDGRIDAAQALALLAGGEL